jgi:hypothetical protein
MLEYHVVRTGMLGIEWARGESLCGSRAAIEGVYGPEGMVEWHVFMFESEGADEVDIGHNENDREPDQLSSTEILSTCCWTGEEEIDGRI